MACLRLLPLFFFSLFLASCHDDDEEVAPLSNQLEYDSRTYDLGMGLTYDFGPFALHSEKTHYAQGILLTDAKSVNQKPNIVLRLYLFNPGTNVPVTGTFEFGDVKNMPSDRAAAKYRWKNFFLNSGLLLDLNKDQELDPDQEYFEIRNGSITLSGTAPDYTVNCNVILETGKPLKAQFKGTFIPITVSSSGDDLTSSRS
ncbi:hypothetical protein [Rufibacter hautae]|nr:hypothetical protein [Rufibacter hautae]